jgi:hypothetical protein
LGTPGSGTPIPKGPDRLLKDERLDAKKGPEYPLIPIKGGGFKYDGDRFTATIAPDGALSFKDKFPLGFTKGQSGFSFDLTDMVMKGGKQDPYAADKRRFRDHTEKLRDEMRQKFTGTQLDNALAALPGELREIWESEKPVGVRRRELYEKWIECADDKEEGDTQGLKARRQIEDFVRRHLPDGSSDAYTDEELRRFANQRDGLPTFQPYRRR